MCDPNLAKLHPPVFLRACDFLQLQLCCFIQTFLSLCHSDAELVKRKGLSICWPRQCLILIGRQFRVGGMAKCRQARMKIARHGAAAECRVGKKDDLSPALAERLNRSCDIGFHFYSRIPRGSQTSLSQTVTFKTIPVQAQ